jgi:hypothetical protein
MGLSPDASSRLVFTDRDGVMRIGLGVEADGSAAVTMVERNGAGAAELGQQDQDDDELQRPGEVIKTGAEAVGSSE